MTTMKQKVLAVMSELSRRDPKLSNELYKSFADTASPDGAFTLQELTVGLKINSVTEAENAVIHYGTDVLLPMPSDLRALVCQALLMLCQKFTVAPNPLWKKILGNPDFYNKWAADDFGNENILDTGLSGEAPPTPVSSTEEN